MNLVSLKKSASKIHLGLSFIAKMFCNKHTRVIYEGNTIRVHRIQLQFSYSSPKTYTRIVTSVL